jgi:hypothetical protein
MSEQSRPPVELPPQMLAGPSARLGLKPAEPERLLPDRGLRRPPAPAHRLDVAAELAVSPVGRGMSSPTPGGGFVIDSTLYGAGCSSTGRAAMAWPSIPLPRNSRRVVVGRPSRASPGRPAGGDTHRGRPRRRDPLGQGDHERGAVVAARRLRAMLRSLPAVLGPERVARPADQARVRFHAAALLDAEGHILGTDGCGRLGVGGAVDGPPRGRPRARPAPAIRRSAHRDLPPGANGCRRSSD